MYKCTYIVYVEKNTAGATCGTGTVNPSGAP